MATFTEIVKESELDRHEVYFLQEGKHKFFAPSPEQEAIAKEKTLKQLRAQEQKERAIEMAKLVHAGGIPECEELGVDIAQLLEKPKHIQRADGGLPLMISLLKRIAKEG